MNADTRCNFSTTFGGRCGCTDTVAFYAVMHRGYVLAYYGKHAWMLNDRIPHHKRRNSYDDAVADLIGAKLDE